MRWSKIGMMEHVCSITISSAVKQSVSAHGTLVDSLRIYMSTIFFLLLLNMGPHGSNKFKTRLFLQITFKLFFKLLLDVHPSSPHKRAVSDF